MSQIGIISSYKNGVNLVVEWKIIDFFTLSEVDGAWYKSPIFSFCGERWRLVIWPNGWSKRNSYGHVDLSLHKRSSDRSIKQSFSITLKTAKREKYNEQQCTKDFDNDDWVHAFNRFIPRSELNKRSELVPEGVLTVVCMMKNTTSAVSDKTLGIISEKSVYKLSYMLAKKSTKILNSAGKNLERKSEDACVKASTQRVEASTQTVEASTQTMGEKCEACASGSSINFQEKRAFHDFKELFLKKEECDVTIKVKGSEFPAHRLILKARSPVLASTFRHDMKESATGILEIDDCDPSSFLDFLYFLYCADVQMITQKNVFDLFTLADKYQVLDLRSKCLEFMKNNLTVDTFCEIITLTLQHSETELIKLSTDYFTKNAPKIIVTVKWQTFLAENPTEGNELFIKLLLPNSS